VAAATLDARSIMRFVRTDDISPYMDDHATPHGRATGWLAVLALAIRAFPNSGS
jgi:hypothetical protein